jgi:DNA-binding LacI/PurR family transcriptional regulator
MFSQPLNRGRSFKMSPIKKVAKACGVSTRTVNRAFNRADSVASNTRTKILKTAKKMGYTPNPAALALKTGKSFEVTAVLKLMEEHHVDKIIGFEKVMQTAGYSVNIVFAATQGNNWRSISKMVKNHIDAVAVFSEIDADNMDNIVNLFEKKGLPYIFIDPVTNRYDSVLIDRKVGVKEAIGHMALNGRKKIAYLGPTDKSYSTQIRLQAYLNAIKALGQEPIVFGTPAESDPVEQHRFGAWSIFQIFSYSKKIDAVQTYTDVMALGLLGALQKNGKKVPREIAVMGFDNREFSQYTNPPLSTVANPDREAGEVAAQILLDKMAKQPRPKNGWQTVLPTRLIVRGSSF